AAQEGCHHQVRDPPGRHRLAGSPGRALVGAHQLPDRALQDPREGSPLAPWPAQARRSAPSPSRLLEAQEPRALPQPHQRPRPPQVSFSHVTDAESSKLKAESGIDPRFRLLAFGFRHQGESHMYIKESVTVGGKELSIETGKMAKQADGSVVVRYGDTMVLVTAVANRTAREGIDFLPLTVEYSEKTASAGKIP